MRPLRIIAVVQARLGSAGLMVPGVEAQVRDDDGNVLAPGEFGELFVRGGQVSGEYVGQGSVLDAEGWFPTRDRASLIMHKAGDHSVTEVQLRKI